MNKALSKEDINKLLKGNSRPDPWPGDTDIKKLALAVKNEQETVTLGKYEFSIRYRDDWQAVFIKPLPRHGVYAPCGWFNYSSLREALKRP